MEKTLKVFLVLLLGCLSYQSLPAQTLTVKGVVTDGYNQTIGHPFVDIAAPNNSIVYAVLDGTIISAGWNDETGYTIQIQHDNDLISVYKHCSKLLKKSY